MSNVSKPYTIPVYKLQLVQEGEREATRISGPEMVAELLQGIAVADREHMVCVHLDTKNRAIACQTVSIGSLNSCAVHVRELFKAALMSNANGVVIAHNHPSNDLTPSAEDDELTQRIIEAGMILGVALLDHVILAPGGGFYSYNEHHAHWFRTSGKPRWIRHAA